MVIKIIIIRLTKTSNQKKKDDRNRPTCEPEIGALDRL